MSDSAVVLQMMIDRELPNTIIEQYNTPERLVENENTVLGIAVSQWTQWDGLRIMRVMSEALTDANFHEEAEVINALCDLQDSDDRSEVIAAVVALISAAVTA